MSSNAFARSRPRVRHQRVPKTQCYSHPRFLQLCKELDRIDEAKKKQTELEEDYIKIKKDEGGSGGGGLDNSSSGCNSGSVTNILVPGATAPMVSNCCSGFNYCSVIGLAQTSNGYRSLEGSNQSSSALHDTYYRQSNHNNCNNHVSSHNHHHSTHSRYDSNHHHYHQHNSHHNSCYHQAVCHLSNNPHHHLRHDDRCPSKCSLVIDSTATTASGHLGYSKQTFEQNVPGFPSSNTDLRQDENRSKRKRTSNDSANNSKKVSASTGTSSKRHKPSPEPSRPLSPSFTKCPICLLDCMDRDPSFTNTCFHLFCYVCIENWSKNKATCPLCRTKFTKIIYNIRSASCFEEKVVSPTRRDDDDERVIYEQLQGINTNTLIPPRSNADDARLLFDNLRNNDVLIPPFAFVNPSQVDSLHSFNSVTNSANFSSSVPHTPFNNFNPIATNYSIALIPSSRVQSTTSTAIASAYATSTGLTNINNDLSNRPRISRTSRYIYTRNYDMPTIDGDARVARTPVASLVQPGIPQSHLQHQHQSHNQHHNQPTQHRTSTIELSARQSRRVEHPHLRMPYPIQSRQYPGSYLRPPYNAPVEERVLDDLYRQMPDI